MNVLKRGTTIRHKHKNSPTFCTLVLLDQRPHGWNCVVIESTHPSYPVGGYDLFIFDEDLGNGELITKFE